MTCPICASPTDPDYRPFCSRRCADRDLARWLNGSYAIPSASPEEDEDALDELEKTLSRADSRPH